VVALDEQWRKSNYSMETLKMEFNKLNKEIGDKKKASKGQDKCDDLVNKSKEIKAAIDAQKLEAEDLDKQRYSKLNLIGNIVSE
jgi:seryl-tRNA synthetase